MGTERCAREDVASAGITKVNAMSEGEDNLQLEQRLRRHRDASPDNDTEGGECSATFYEDPETCDGQIIKCDLLSAHTAHASSSCLLCLRRPPLVLVLVRPSSTVRPSVRQSVSPFG